MYSSLYAHDRSVCRRSSKQFVRLLCVHVVRVKDRIEPFCIGCLSEADARRFYEQLTADVSRADRARLPTFEQAFEVVGGHPMHMRELVEGCLERDLLQRGLIHLRPCVQYNYLLQGVVDKDTAVGVGYGWFARCLRRTLMYGLLVRAEISIPRPKQ